MSQTPHMLDVSVIVRTKNSESTVLDTLRSIRVQSVPVEIVVVDSGSTDDTLDIVAEHADVLVHTEPATFSFGGALNTGAAAASGGVLVALSSHSVLPRPDWVAVAAAHVRAGALAACGQDGDGEGGPLTRPVRRDHQFLVDHPYWGMSNHASAWSADAWRRHHFDEDLPAAEDREWSWRVTRDGGWIVFDPALLVPGGHRRSAGVRSYFRRLVKEGTALGPLRAFPRYTLRDAARDWASPDPRTPLVSSASRARGRTRLVEVAARWQAGRVNPERPPGEVPR